MLSYSSSYLLVGLSESKLLESDGMATSKEIRRENLKRLLGGSKGAQAKLAQDLDVDPAYVSQLVLGKRNMGDATARNIEVKRRLPEGWLDARHEEGVDAPAVDLAPMERALLGMFKILSPKGQSTAYGEVTKIFLEERGSVTAARTTGDGIDYNRPNPFEDSHEERSHVLHEPERKKARTK
jgi:hypothetical protein